MGETAAVLPVVLVCYGLVRPSSPYCTIIGTGLAGDMAFASHLLRSQRRTGQDQSWGCYQMMHLLKGWFANPLVAQATLAIAGVVAIGLLVRLSR